MPHPFPHFVPPRGPDARRWLPHQVQSLRTTIEEACQLLLDAQHAITLLSDASQVLAPPPESVSAESDDLGTLTITQIQEKLGVSRSTVYALLDSGELAWTKVGKRRRILRSDLFDYLHNKSKAS